MQLTALEIADRLGALGAATVGEAGGVPMAPRIRAMHGGSRVVGPAFPVRCTPGDNLAVHVAVVSAPAGSVLCVDVGDEWARGYWGEVLTTAAQARSLAGLVIDGGVRDIEALDRLAFPVFARDLVLRGATKEQAGTIGRAAPVGDVMVQANDWIVGDRDGVAVVSAAALDDVLARGAAREAKERHIFEALRTGQTTIDLLGLDPSPISRGE